MFIEKVEITNFKYFGEKITFSLDSGLTILVGDNDAGKSTILEAINLALTGYLHGKPLSMMLSQYLFNQEVVEEYLKNINSHNNVLPPKIKIDIFLLGDKKETALFWGDGYINEKKENQIEIGFSFIVELDPRFHDEYQLCIHDSELRSIPIEYYYYYWKTFSRDDHITPKNIPIKSLLVDSSGALSSQTSSRYISRIIKNKLDSDTIVSVSQAHRKLKDSFKNDNSIQAANNELKSKGLEEEIELAVELGTKNEWEDNVTIEISSHPFQYLGRGRQSIISIDVVLAKGSEKPEIVLIEEPENHLSHSNLNKLIHSLTENLKNKQVLITTHSSFVANKLGLKNLVLLENSKMVRLKDLTKETQDYFLRLAGYDSLRLLLCKKAILVEGPSDELIIQKAYRINNNGKLPIQDGLDVISVGNAFLRFLEISKLLVKQTVVVTDVDYDVNALKEKYSEFLGPNAIPEIKIVYDPNVDSGVTSIEKYNWNTLEPKLLKSNGFENMCRLLGKAYCSEDDLRKYMLNNKSEYALKLFNSDQPIKFPEYILRAINEE